MKKYQIFVSSTFKDLREERQAAVEAILKASHIPAGMELFAAGSESQLETIKRWIDSCDIYMLILGSRYGSIEPKSGKSYTELEYDYAVSQDKPFFAVVITDDAISRKAASLGKEILELENPSLLAGFRGKVLSKTSSFFSDIKDVKLAVFESVSDMEKRYTLGGWIPLNEVPDTRPLLAEITRLTKLATMLEKAKKSAEVKLAKVKSFDARDDEFAVLQKLLMEEIGTTDGHPVEEGKDTTKLPILKFLYLGCDDFAAGIENVLNMKSWDNFLFWNIAPKLQVHGLIVFNKVPGVRYRRCEFTEKGQAFVSYLKRSGVFSAWDKHMAATKPKKEKP